jgi:hypothetical protein
MHAPAYMHNDICVNIYIFMSPIRPFKMEVSLMIGTIEEVPLLDRSALQEVSPVQLNEIEEGNAKNNSGPVGNRTRSLGPAEDLSVNWLNEIHTVVYYLNNMVRFF